MARDTTAAYPLVVIDVKSIDATLKKVAKSGGKVVLPKQNVGDFGYYARIKDTEDNTIGLWEK